MSSRVFYVTVTGGRQFGKRRQTWMAPSPLRYFPVHSQQTQISLNPPHFVTIFIVYGSKSALLESPLIEKRSWSTKGFLPLLREA